MDSFSPFKTDDSSIKLMSPIESCYRSPLRDTTNCALPLDLGGNKKSDPVGPQQLPGEKRDFREENDFPQYQQTTPVRHLDCDTESDTTAEYESAGEASPWEKPSNVSALADYLAGVHLSTPDKIHTELTHFPFSPISAEDECDDEVTAIISSGSQSSSHTLSFHEREEISVSRENKTVSDVANTSFSDVDPEEFKNSASCKRHSETNISSFFHPETLQFSDEAIVKDEVSFETEMSCSIEGNKLKTPSPSLNESKEITSSVVAMVDRLCDSVSNQVTSETISPKKYTSLNLSSSGGVIESILTDPSTSVANDERKLVEQSPSAMRSVPSFSSSNKSPVSVIIEKDVTSLDSLEENNVTVTTEIDSSSNVLGTHHINDYVTSTKHKIDTIFSSNKEIVSNVISETKQQIDNMFRRKSPIKELTSNTVSHVIDGIKNLNATESDSSPRRNVLIEKVSSPISSAKQKIDSLFSPKKTVHDKETSGVAVVKELCENELFKKENNDNSQNNTVTVENLDVNTSVSGLSVIPLTPSENHEVIETTKQQIDKIFKSLSPQNIKAPSEVLELRNSTDVKQEGEISLTCEPGFEQHNPKPFLETKSSMDESLSSSKGVNVSAQQEAEIYQSLISYKGEPWSSFALRKVDRNSVFENLNETCTLSEVIPPLGLISESKTNISSGSFASSEQLTDRISGQILNNTITDKACETTCPGDITVAQSDKKTVCGFDDDFQVINDSISQHSIKIVEQHLSDYESTFEVLNKDVLDESRTFHVISPKKESLNISLSTILDYEEVTVSENITEPLKKLPVSDSIVTNMSENDCQKMDSFVHTINSQSGMSSIASNIGHSDVTMEHEKLGVCDSSYITSLESSEIINNKHTDADGSLTMDPLKSLESAVDSLDVDLKEIDNIAEMKRTADQEVISNQVGCEELNDFDSQLKSQQGSLDITAVSYQMSLRKEEVEDFVVVDATELDNHGSIPVSPQLSSSDFQNKEVLDTSHASGQFGVEKKLHDKNEKIQPTSSELDVSQMKINENQVQMEPSPFVEESFKDNAEATISDVDKQINDEHIEKNDGSVISELDLVAGTINVQEDVNCSSLVVSCVMKNDVSNIVCDGHQSNIQSLEVTPPNVELVESKSNATENNLTTDVKKDVINVSISAEVRDTDVKGANFQSQEVVAPNVELVEKVESKSSITENDLTTELVVEKDVMNVSIPAEVRDTDVKGANFQSQEVMAPNVELVKKVESKSNITENDLTTDLVVEKDVINVSISAEERDTDVKGANFQSQEVVAPNVELVEKVESKSNITENDLTTELVVEKDVMNVSIPAEVRDTDVKGANFQSQEVMAPNVELVKKVESKSNITENDLTTDLVVEKDVINVSIPAEVRDTDVKGANFQSQEVMAPNVELVKKVESKSNITENNLTTDIVVRSIKDVINVSISAEERDTDVKVTGVDENISVLDVNNDFNKTSDDSVCKRNDIEQLQSSLVYPLSSSSVINTLKNEDLVSTNTNLNTIPKSPIKEECVETIHDFKVGQIQSESKQGQIYGEEGKCSLRGRIEEEKCTISGINSEVKIDHCSSKVSAEHVQVMAKKTEDNVLINESVVSSNNETSKLSSKERKISPPGTAANELFSEIFQHGKDQMRRTTTMYAESKQSKSEVSVIKEQVHETIEQNSNSAACISKSTGNSNYNNTDFFKNAGFSSEHILSDKVKSPPFACPVSSDTIAFGSPSELSLSPLNSFSPGNMSESPKSSPSSNTASNSTATVTCNKTYSSSAEIRMGLESSSESIETIESDVSKQNYELSSSLQATLQTQGEMSTRNEKYTYNVSKNPKDFRSSPLNKNSEEVKFSSLSDKFRTFKLDDLSKSTIERKSYEDLLDRCLEQERLLGFDETIKEEADKLIQEIANASSDDICLQPDDFPPANANSSEAGPVTADEDLNKADLFQDATLFDFDYLSKIGKGKPSRRLVRESLFLKFDPLAAAAAAVATPEPAQEMAQADSSSDLTSTPTRAPPVHNGDEKLVSITPNDEAACSPASSTVATPPRSKARTSSCSATPTLRHEILSKEISKLQELMMRQESSYQEQIAARTEEVELLREQLAELEARDNQSNLQGKLAATEAEAVKLRKELADANESKKQLMMIMEEYEKTISQVVTMREDDKKKFEIEKEQISMEREGAMQHLRNMEIAFNDVHQKYEKCKEVIEAFKHNEEQYKISLNENRKTIIQQEENYQKLKEHAAQKLDQANIEISEMKKAHQAEIAKMVAVQRKMEIRVKSLEESLEQKKREAAELTKICDDLITKVEQ